MSPAGERGTPAISRFVQKSPCLASPAAELVNGAVMMSD